MYQTVQQNNKTDSFFKKLPPLLLVELTYHFNPDKYTTKKISCHQNTSLTRKYRIILFMRRKLHVIVQLFTGNLNLKPTRLG
jgi:hypothetical protein